jgi:acetyl-CoA/propionyl-CoA carboxylase biotin carboxyl carrier protein
VAEGDAVEPGQVICIVEAMKMENEVTATVAGTVVELAVAELQPISIGERIAVIEPS